MPQPADEGSLQAGRGRFAVGTLFVDRVERPRLLRDRADRFEHAALNPEIFEGEPDHPRVRLFFGPVRNHAEDAAPRAAQKLRRLDGLGFRFVRLQVHRRIGKRLVLEIVVGQRFAEFQNVRVLRILDVIGILRIEQELGQLAVIVHRPGEERFLFVPVVFPEDVFLAGDDALVLVELAERPGPLGLLRLRAGDRILNRLFPGGDGTARAGPDQYHRDQDQERNQSGDDPEVVLLEDVLIELCHIDLPQCG